MTTTVGKWNVPIEATILRPVWADHKNNEFKNYEGLRFLEGGAQAVDQVLRQCVVGVGEEDDDDDNSYIFDFLAPNGDILGEVLVTRYCFRQLIRRFGLKRDRGDEEEYDAWLEARS